MVTVSTVAAKAPSAYEYLSVDAAAAELEVTFNGVSNGVTARINGSNVKVVTKAQYLRHFNTSEETRYGETVVAKFHCHDANGDGVLTLEEVNTLCD